MFKVVVYVPTENAKELREAIGRSGGGKIGSYSFCSFSSSGIGRFKPEKGASPAVGTVGASQEVEEERIEFVCDPLCIDEVIMAIRKAHPYEEPAIDVWRLEKI